MINKVQLTQCPLGKQPTLHHDYNFSHYSPLPDMCHSGPVVGYPGSKPSPGRSVDLVTRKHHSAPALEPTSPCCVPCVGDLMLQPPSDAALSASVRRRCHRGNLLQTICLGKDQHLFQAVNTASGSSLMQFTLLPLPDKHLPQLAPVAIYKKDVSVCDLQCKSINNEMFVLTRSLHTVDVHRVGDVCLDYMNKKFHRDEALTSASLNAEVPGFWLQSDEKQKVRLYDSHRTNAVWTHKLPDVSSAMGAQWSASVFGYRSYTGIAANNTSIYTADFRVQKFQNLFNMHDKKSDKLSDVICGLTTLPDRPYFVCVCNEQLLLFDDRNCRIPVLTWNHMLLDVPQRAVIFGGSQQDILALTNNTEKRLCLVEVANCTAEVETCEHHLTASLVKHHDLYNSMQHFAHHRDLWFDDAVSKRLNQDMNGLACQNIQGSSDRNIFVSNVCGDIFCQSFSLKMEQVSDPSNDVEKEIVEHMQNWEESITALTLTSSAANVNRFDVTHCLEKVLPRKKSITLTKTFSSNNDVWNVASMVKQYQKNYRHKEALADKKKLNWADILVDEYNIDHKHITKGAPSHMVFEPTQHYFSTAMHKRLRDESLESFRDSLGKTILSHWPLSRPAINMDVTEIDANKSTSLDTYRALSYSSLLAHAGMPSKYKPLSRSASVSLKSTRASSAPSVCSSGPDDGSVGTLGGLSRASVGTSGGRSGASDAGTPQTELKRLLVATTPASLKNMPSSCLSETFSTLTAKHNVLNPTPSLSCSVRKKKKRHAGF